MTSYTLRRQQNLVDLLIPRHDWSLVTLRDGVGETGVYSITAAGYTFTQEDGTAGVDNSAALVTAFIAAINGSIAPVTAFAGPTVNDLRLRHDDFGGQLHTQVATTDADGSIRAVASFPDDFDIQRANNWDASFSSMQIVQFHQGYISTSLKRSREALDSHVINAQQLRNYTRVLFTFEDYSESGEVVQFLQIIPRFGGAAVSGLTSPIIIVLTEQQYRDNLTDLILAGEAPVAASQADALLLELPRQSSSYEITNLETTGGDSLFVSFGVGTAELEVAAETVIRNNRLNVGQLTIRSGGAGTVTIDMAITLNMNPRF